MRMASPSAAAAQHVTGADAETAQHGKGRLNRIHYPFLLQLIILSAFTASLSQTLVSTTRCYFATANHNQRKIVRTGIFNNDSILGDTLYIFYQNQKNDINYIELVKLAPNFSPVINREFLRGKCPSATIGKNGKIHLVFESDDSLSQIMYCTLSDSPANPVSISRANDRNHYPVIEVDGSNRIHIAWIQNDGRLAYTTLDSSANLIDTTYLSRDSEIVFDVGIACNLEFQSEDVLITYNYRRPNDSASYIMTLLNGSFWMNCKGSFPCVTLGRDWYPACIYQDENYNIIWSGMGTLIDASYNFIAIDDIAPPPAFSFIYMSLFGGGICQADVHTYSVPLPLGGHTNEYSVLSSEPIGNGAFNASIAYKRFNPKYIDVIWLEEVSDTLYNIFHQRRLKTYYTSGIYNAPKLQSGVDISVRPNPFNPSTCISYNLRSDSKGIMRIFNIRGRKIFERTVQGTGVVLWDATRLPSGVYLVKVLSAGIIQSSKCILQR